MSRGLPIIAPSVLAADYSRLGAEVASLEEAGADWHHVDIMDGHFVPNISFGYDFQGFIQKSSSLPIDTHLMLVHPSEYLDHFIQKGSAGITIHVECSDPVPETLKAINDKGLRSGISLKPGTNVTALEPFLEQVQLVLVMTVEPGFGGQSFMPDMLEKIKWLHDQRDMRGLSYLIEVDGGINQETGLACRQAGADVFVAGSFLYQSSDRKHTLSEFKAGLKAAC